MSQGRGWGTSGGGGTPGLREGVFFILGVAVLYVIFGVAMQLVLGEAGVFFAQVGVLLVPALLFVHLRGYDRVETFSLRPMSPRGLLGAMLLMTGGLPIAWVLSWLQSFVIEVPVELLEGLSGFLQADDPLRILWLVLLVAVTPAICEEFLFRGVLLSSLRSRLTTVGAVVLSGVIFGIFHLSPETAFRFLPTAWLGILLAWVVVETRSIWTAVILHFLNNGSILLLTLLPSTRGMATNTEQEPPWLFLPVAVMFLLAGAWLLRRVGREYAERDALEAIMVDER